MEDAIETLKLHFIPRPNVVADRLWLKLEIGTETNDPTQRKKL